MTRKSVDWEKDIYQAGLHLNRWPYTEVVSAFTRRLANWNQDEQPRVLEVGFGAGNNLWFLASAGFSVSGVELSPTAVAVAKERLQQNGLMGDLRVGRFESLPFNSESFDFVLDRGALTHGLHSDVHSATDEIFRILKPSGQLLSFTLFGEDDPGRLFGEEVAPGTYDNFSGGSFLQVGQTSFFTAEILAQHFAKFADVEILCNRIYRNRKIVQEHYSLTATKRAPS